MNVSDILQARKNDFIRVLSVGKTAVSIATTFFLRSSSKLTRYEYMARIFDFYLKKLHLSRFRVTPAWLSRDYLSLMSSTYWWLLLEKLTMSNK